MCVVTSELHGVVLSLSWNVVFFPNFFVCYSPHISVITILIQIAVFSNGVIAGMLLLWKAKHVGFCWSKIWMPFLMPSQQCPTHACVVVYSKRCVHDVGRVTCRQCIINCSIFSTAHWLTLSTEYTDSDGSRGVTSHLPGVAAYFMLLLFMWHKSYFGVVLCPSSSQILATNAQISFSCKPRPPQCSGSQSHPL